MPPQTFLTHLDTLLTSLSLPPLTPLHLRTQHLLRPLASSLPPSITPLINDLLDSPLLLPTLSCLLLAITYLSSTLLRSSPSPKIKSKSKSKSTSKKAPTRPTPPPKLQGSARIAQLRASNESTLYPLLDAFIASPPANEEERKDHHTRLSESLMAVMLQLDAVETGGDLAVRGLRKEFVREMQGRLEALDRALEEGEG